MSILDALINKVDGGESYFDRYATEDLKKQVMEYITISTSDSQWGNKTHYYPKVGPDKLAGNNPWIQNCKGELTLEGEYVMLVCARNSYKNENEGINYGFAAARGLYKPDDVPPALITPMVGTDGTVSVPVRTFRAYDPDDSPRKWHYRVDEYGLGPQSWRYYGTIDISFDKPIYYYDGNNLKQIVAAEKGDAPDGQISILDVIGGSIITAATDNTAHTAFTLTYSGIGSGQGFTISRLFNSSGSEEGKSPKTLVVTFDTSNLDGEIWPGSDGKVMDMRTVMPCFNVSWKEPPK